jgi:hypothetical protein
MRVLFEFQSDPEVETYLAVYTYLKHRIPATKLRRPTPPICRFKASVKQALRFAFPVYTFPPLF